jgi:hypothetical protein
VVVLNGWQTIYDAFVKKGIHFADRVPFFVDSQHVNQELRGVKDYLCFSTVAVFQNVTGFSSTHS